MKFGKIAILGTILACSAPFAAATPIPTPFYGSIVTAGTGSITSTSSGNPAVFTATGLTYANATFTTQTNALSNPYYQQSAGTVLSTDLGFDNLLTTASMHYVTGATSTTPLIPAHGTPTKYAAGARTKAALLFPTTLGTVQSPAIEFYEIRQGSEILDLYITEIDTTAVGANAVAGKAAIPAKTTGSNQHPYIPAVPAIPATSSGFSGVAYVTTDGGVTKSFGDFTLTFTAGKNQTGFSTNFVSYTPEPSSLALLGTGMLSVAGMGFRKFRRTV